MFESASVSASGGSVSQSAAARVRAASGAGGASASGGGGYHSSPPARKGFGFSDYDATGGATSVAAAPSGSGSPASPPPLAPSALPRPALFGEAFELADANGDGRVDGGEARTFFSQTRVSQQTLARVWVAADERKQGSLDEHGFVMMMWLVGLAQSGAPPTVDALAAAAASEQGLPLPELPEIDAWRERAKGRLAAAQRERERANAEGAPSTASWFGLGRKRPKPKPKIGAKNVNSMIEALKQLYAKKVRPLEEETGFAHFYSPALRDADFDAKPTVLLLGQYSVGKTSFIRYILGRDYPSAQIGPEPTTDRFVAVMHGWDEGITPGNTLAVQTDKPFTALQKFGTAFLNKFCASNSSAELLEHITLIDTPGVLSGEKQRVERSYDFAAAIEWFAERADLVLLLFDPHKLDISDEFKRAISAVRMASDDKVRVVLNKADQVSTQQLMRVYGALMWSISRVVKTPEVLRVYIGNFRDAEYMVKDNAELLDREREDLLNDLYDLPRRSVARKINEFVKRTRATKIHAYIMSYLRGKLPTFGKEKWHARQIEKMEATFRHVAAQHGLAAGDFPPLEYFREKMRDFKIAKIPSISKRSIERLDEVLSNDLPALMKEYGNPFASTADGEAASY